MMPKEPLPPRIALTAGNKSGLEILYLKLLPQIRN